MILENIKKLIQSLESRKIITDKGCWELDVTPNDSGYLRIGNDNKRYRLSRISAAYYLELDLDDPKQLALHKNECHNRKCWNPDHLYVGTSADNNDDSIKMGRKAWGGGINKDKTHCSEGHPLDGLRGNGVRYCKECNRLRARKNQEKYKNSPKVKCPTS